MACFTCEGGSTTGASVSASTRLARLQIRASIAHSSSSSSLVTQSTGTIHSA